MTRVTLDTGSNGIQLQLEYGGFVDGSTGGTITADSSTAKLSNAEAWIDANGYPFYDSSNALSYSGGWIDPEGTLSNIDIPTTSGTRKLKELGCQSRSIIFGSSEGTYAVALTLTGINSAGTMSGSKTFAAPRRPYHAPSPPAVTLTAAGVASIPATQNAASKDYYVETTDWRWETNGVFADYAMNQANSVTSKTVNMVGDNKYRMAVRQKNDDGASSYGYSGYVYSTPDSPQSLTGARQTLKTTVVLNWTSTAQYVAAFLIERSLDGAAYQQIDTTTAKTYTDTDVPVASTASYRVRVQSPTGVNTAYSVYSSILTIAKGYSVPDAPTSVKLARSNNVTHVITFAGNVNDLEQAKYWQYVEWDLQTDTGSFVATGTGIAGTTQTIYVGGLIPNKRYRVQVRSRNAAGASTSAVSNYTYNEPTAPSALTAARADAASTTVNLAWTTNGAWVADNIVERSTDNGANWVQIGNSNTTAYIDTLSTPSTGLYRVKAQTPAPIVESLWSNIATVGAALSTDMKGIPGVSRIYEGVARVRIVNHGGTRIWIDGTP